MKTLITGGCGFIGMALSRRLVEDGHGVVIVDSLSPQIHGELPDVSIPDGADFHRVDVRSLAVRSDLIESCDAVFHLAAETGTGQSMYDIGHYVDVNDAGTAALLEALAKCSRRRRRLVLASSRSVYGEGAYMTSGEPRVLVQPPARSREQLAAGRWEHTDHTGRELERVPTPESLPFSPGSVYAATKVAQEMLIRSATEALDLDSVILRFQNVYGAGQSLRNPYTGIISIFFNRARQGLGIPLYEDGLESRDFVHVNDVVDALTTALTADLPRVSVINVGSGVPTSVADLAAKLIEITGFNAATAVTGQFRIGDIRHCFADVSRLRELLGIVPRVSLDQGLRSFHDWAAAQPVEVDRLDVAARQLRARGLSN